MARFYYKGEMKQKKFSEQQNTVKSKRCLVEMGMRSFMKNSFARPTEKFVS